MASFASHHLMRSPSSTYQLLLWPCRTQFSIFFINLCSIYLYCFHSPYSSTPKAEKKRSMSSMEMTSLSKFAYHKLKHEIVFDDEREGVIRRSQKWYRFRRVRIRRRFRLKVPSLRRLWRKKARVVSAMRVSCAKVMRRLKEGQGHFGDLFAGNYMFMQVSPSSLKCLDKGHHTNGFTSSFSIPKLAY